MTHTRLSPGSVAVVAGALVLLVAAVRPVTVHPSPPAVDSAPAVDLQWLEARRGASPESPPIPPDRFRLAAGLSETIAEHDVEPVVTPYLSAPIPRIVGVGRRPDGVAFAGCEVPGEKTRIVRLGEMCGSFRLVSVDGDSVRLATEPADSVVAVGIGNRR